MTEYSFNPTIPNAPSFIAVQKPFWKLIINARDLSNVMYYKLKEWDKSVTCDEIACESNNFIGLNSSNSNATVELTKTIEFNEDGYYLIFLRMQNHPKDNGNVLLYIDDKKIWEKQEAENKWWHTRTIMYPITYYSKGSHSFNIKISKQAYVHEMFIYKINRYVASSDKAAMEKHAKKIDVTNINFTENSVNENNILTANISLQDNLYDPDNESLLFTEFGDPVTLILGHDYKNAVPKFGGYTIAPSVQDDNIQLKVMDRLLDMIIQPTDHNFSIGIPPSSDYVEYGSVYELAEYLTATLEYPLTINTNPYEYGFQVDFKSTDSIVTTLYATSKDATKGNPPPSLFIKPGTTQGDGEVVLWSSSSTNTCDAAVYNYLFFPYSFYGVTNPLPVNVAVEMFKAGQTSANAVRYIIAFTGASVSNPLGTVKPDLSNSGWPGFKFDLKKAFDSIPTAQSTEYNISKISLIGTINSTQTSNPNNYGIWIPSVMSYKEIFNAPKYSSSDSQNVYEAFQRLCDETNHVAFVNPGMDRTEDILMILPENSISSSGVTLDETTNVRRISSWNYDPLNDGLCNQRHGIYTVSDSNGNETKYNSYYEDMESIKSNRRIKTLEVLEGINNQVDADKSVKNYVNENKIKKVGVEIPLDGNVLFSPSEYVLTRINSKRLTGDYQIKGITQTLDILGGDFETVLGINRLPGEFRNRQRNLLKFYQNNRKIIY